MCVNLSNDLLIQNTLCNNVQLATEILTDHQLIRCYLIDNFFISKLSGAYYRTAQNFGRTKLWRIWWTISNPPKFYPPNVVSSNCELFSVISRQNFFYQFSCSSESAKDLFRQRFVLYGIRKVITSKHLRLEYTYIYMHL